MFFFRDGGKTFKSFSVNIKAKERHKKTNYTSSIVSRYDYTVRERTKHKVNQVISPGAEGGYGVSIYIMVPP